MADSPLAHPGREGTHPMRVGPPTPFPAVSALVPVAANGAIPASSSMANGGIPMMAIQFPGIKPQQQNN